MPKPRALPESLGSGLCLRVAAVRSSSVVVLRRDRPSGDNREKSVGFGGSLPPDASRYRWLPASRYPTLVLSLSHSGRVSSRRRFSTSTTGFGALCACCCLLLLAAAACCCLLLLAAAACCCLLLLAVACRCCVLLLAAAACCCCCCCCVLLLAAAASCCLLLLAAAACCCLLLLLAAGCCYLLLAAGCCCLLLAGCCCSPRRFAGSALSEPIPATPIERRAARESTSRPSAADLVVRAPVVSSCAACAVPAAPPGADRRHPHAQPRCCSSIAAPAPLSRHDDGERAPSREHVVP